MKGISGYLVLKFEASTPTGLGSGSFFKIPNLMCYVVYIKTCLAGNYVAYPELLLKMDVSDLNYFNEIL